VQGRFDDRIYVFTPQAALVELTAGATPVDFAYALHTDLGHRCRGAKVDGAMVPLNTPLANGQTVEITAVKEGGPRWTGSTPSRFPQEPAGPRQGARLVQRPGPGRHHRPRPRGGGKAAAARRQDGLKLSELASQLGFKEADDLFELVGKDEYSLRNIEQLLRPPPAPSEDDNPLLKRTASDAPTARGGVLVVGVDSLLTNLARCCRPAPPDAIGGFVTRGKGVAVHRQDCSNFRHMADRMPERVIAVTWGAAAKAGEAAYPVDVQIEAADRTALLRDISEVFAKERMQVVGVHSQTVTDMHGRTARMTFTIEVADASRLQQVLVQVGQVAGVRQVRRR
jgi:GTP pyrophosphokinase